MRFASALTLAMLIAYINAQSTTTKTSGTTATTTGTTATTTGTAATTTTVDVTTPDDPAVKKAWVDQTIKDAQEQIK
jgi:hypothetical protein